MSSRVLPITMRQLVNELTKLPAIGEKSAMRLAYHILTRGRADARLLGQALTAALEVMTLCRECFFFADDELCRICSDPSRLKNVLCVVEKPQDVLALERAGSFRGTYHVLHGLWSPLRGIGTEELKIRELLVRVNGRLSSGSDAQDRYQEETKRNEIKSAENKSVESKIEEVVLATSTTVEGDATALYIAGQMSQMGVKITRIAQGLPKGGELEFADDLTLAHAFRGRHNL